MAILHPFEDAYKRNLAEQHRRATLTGSRQPGAQQQQQGPPASSGQGRAPQAGPGGASQSGFLPQIQGGTAGSMMNLMGQSISASAPSTSAPSFSIPSQPNPHPPHHRPPSSSTPSMAGQGASQNLGATLSSDIPGMNVGQQTSTGLAPQGLDQKNVLDQDAVSIKRKLDSEEPESKRTRQKTGNHGLFCRQRSTHASL